MTNIATVIFEDTGEVLSQTEIDVYREHITYELTGAKRLEGTYPFTLESIFKAFRVNDLLHRLVIPEHRERFLTEQKAFFEEFGLITEEQMMIREQKWIEIIRYGVSFFDLEKMAAVVGVSNPHEYASIRGADLETFLKTRKVPMSYSVAGGGRTKELEKQ